MMNLRYPSVWLAKVGDGLARIADRPWTLFFLLFTINTVAQPYAGITHDARLYSVQVLNQVENGAYADDLFFRYGSQDQYSLFSRLAAPLVQVFGLPTAFFLIYLLSKSLLLFGMIRIVQTLVPNRLAGALALIYAMAVSIHYGGQHILNLQENFVTPRMPACALVLVGLDLLLGGRPISSGLAMLLAAALHPLMAFGGLLIWAGFCTWKYLGGKAFIGACVASCALAAAVLAIEPLGLRCFGAMDDDWREAILHASSFNFPSQWSHGDWCYLAFQMALLSVVIWKYRAIDADKMRFWIVLMIVTLAATVGAVLAEQLPYALFLQGQPYRAMWMLAFLHLALACWLCVECSKDASLLWQLAGCVLLAYLCCVNAIKEEYAFPLLLFPVLAVALRGLEREPRDRAWLVQSVQLSLVLGGLAWAVYKLALLIHGRAELHLFHPEYLDILEVVLQNLGPIVFVFGLCWLLVRFMAQGMTRPAWPWLAAGCLGLQAFYFAVPHTDFYRAHATQYRADMQEVHVLIQRDRPVSQPLPTVYSNLGCLDYVWIDLHAQSYFDWWQAGNYMFRREMAVEGQRRAAVVAPFELARYHRYEDMLTQGRKDAIARFFQTDFNHALDRADFVRLCQEPGLDYVVLEQHIDGVPSVRAGRLYLYSCKEARIALGLPAPKSRERVALRER